MTTHAAWVSALFLAASTAGVLGGTNGFVVPAFRGQPDSTFTGWESFKVGVGDPGNAGDLAGSSDRARLFQLAPGALVLGSGNIYNGGEASRFEIRYSGAEPVGEVVFQARALGTEFKYDDVRLYAWTQALTATRVELDRLSFGGPPGTPGSGYAVSSEWSWDLTGLGASNFAISFNAAEINLSLDSATLDVRAVPEPGPLALGALGALGLMALGARRRRS